MEKLWEQQLTANLNQWLKQLYFGGTEEREIIMTHFAEQPEFREKVFQWRSYSGKTVLEYCFENYLAAAMPWVWQMYSEFGVLPPQEDLFQLLLKDISFQKVANADILAKCFIFFGNLSTDNTSS